MGVRESHNYTLMVARVVVLLLLHAFLFITLSTPPGFVALPGCSVISSSLTCLGISQLYLLIANQNGGVDWANRTAHKAVVTPPQGEGNLRAKNTALKRRLLPWKWT